MLGIMMIFVMGAVLFLHIFVTKQFSKLGKDSYIKRFIFGSLGFLLVFSLFFGDHVIATYKIGKACRTLNKDVTYDKKLYDEYIKNNYGYAKNPDKYLNIYKKLTNKELDEFKQTYKNINDIDKATSANLDFKNDVISFSYDINRGYIRRIVQVSDNKLIYYHKKYFGDQGGWFCKKINSITHGYTCPIRCK